jgi:hypothetical protein
MTIPAMPRKRLRDSIAGDRTDMESVEGVRLSQQRVIVKVPQVGEDLAVIRVEPLLQLIVAETSHRA